MRRRVLGAALGGWALSRHGAVRALMAGLPPDTPEARVDPNRPQSPWAGVVAVRVLDGVYSGALVHRRAVLTAAHVAGGRPAAEVTVQFNAGPEPVMAAVEQVHVHPRFTGVARPFMFHDVALLVLAQDAPAGVPVYRPHRRALTPGARLLLVGYGGSGAGDAGPTVPGSARVKRVGENRADRFVPDPERQDLPALFLYDFDGPDEASNRMGGSTLGNHRETSAAGGDSGAPAFVAAGEFPQLAGVLTFTTDWGARGTPMSTFGASGGGVLVASVLDWLDPLLAAAGTAPTADPGTK
jgi:hypothetical protein